MTFLELTFDSIFLISGNTFSSSISVDPAGMPALENFLSQLSSTLEEGGGVEVQGSFVEGVGLVILDTSDTAGDGTGTGTG